LTHHRLCKKKNKEKKKKKKAGIDCAEIIQSDPTTINVKGLIIFMMMMMMMMMKEIV
jgi:hypothetical protein